MNNIDRGPQGRHRSKTSNAADDLVLEELGRRFTDHRRRRKRPSRIPNSLRQIAVELLARGVSPAALRRRCGVTGEQLRQWQHDRCMDGAAAGDASEVADTPCFSVVDVLDGDGDGGATRGREALELRVGTWAITIRPTQD